jgi:NADH-quinone oxidoreductase subunit C
VTAPLFDQLLQQLVPATANEPDGAVPADTASAVHSLGVQHDVLVLAISPAALLPLAQRLRDEFTFDLFLDVTAVDWPGDALRFEVVHHFYSTMHKVRVRLKMRVSEADPHVDSLTPLYGSAGYMERECHDMYGIVFRGNPDLRPILLYEGFVGHPLRKDYPKQKEQPLVPYLPPQGALVR